MARGETVFGSRMRIGERVAKVQALIENTNGWQRLFVVVAVIWTIVAGYLTYVSFPTHRGVTISVGNEWQPLFDEYDRKIESARLACRTRFPGEDSTSIMARINCLRDVNESLVMERRKEVQTMSAVWDRRLEQLPFRQAGAIGVALLLWLIPLIATYAAGVWVARGFTKHS